MSPILALILLNLIWGAAPPIFKFALQDIPPFTLAFIRFFFGGLIFVPMALKYWTPLSREDWQSLIWSGLWGITINITFFFLGLKYAPSINVHIFSSIGPVLLYFLSLSMLHEKAHPEIIKGIVISLLGTFIIVLAPLFFGPGAGGTTQTVYTPLSMVIGNLFFFLSMIGSILYTVYNKKVVKRVNPFVITFITFMVGAVSFFPIMLWELQSWSFTQLETHSWVGIVYGVFFSSAAAYGLHNYVVGKMDAQAMGIFTYIEPLVAVIVAFPLLHESPDLAFIVGSVLVFAGIYWSQKQPHYQHMNQKLREKEI